MFFFSLPASQVLAAMNTEVDPCDNFFEFACGQWVDTHQIPEDKGAIDQMELATNKVEFDLQGNSPKYTHTWDQGKCIFVFESKYRMFANSAKSLIKRRGVATYTQKRKRAHILTKIWENYITVLTDF